MADCQPANCSSWGELQANSEIAGIGVVIGFMSTAYITLIVVFIYYLFDHYHTTNPVDRVIIDGAAKAWRCIISDRAKPSQKWSFAIEAAVLMYSDQQLVTGIGILISGFTQIRCSLSAYHWQVVVYLAWFSSLTHLTTLTALRVFFRSQPTLAYWRVFFMGCTIVLLGTALAPTGYVSENSFQRTALAVPALCMFTTEGYNEASSSNSVAIVDLGNSLQPFNWLFIMLSLLFLLVSYVSRVVSLFTQTSVIARFWLRTVPGNRLKKSIIRALQRSDTSERAIFRKVWAMEAIIKMTMYVLLKVVFDIGQSMLWEIFWLLAALAWGTIRLLAALTNSHPSEQDIWGFGQVMALLLITLPVFSIGEQLFTKSKSPSLYPNRTHTTLSLSLTDSLRTGRSVTHNSALPNDAKDLIAFKDLTLEKEDWYWNLGLLVFGMAILVMGDILYDFPSGPLTNYSWGTSYLTQNWWQICVEYLIWFGLIALILFVYTAICITFDRDLLHLCCKYIFRTHLRVQYIVLKIAGYVVVFLLLAGTMVFDAMLFYDPNPFSDAYYSAGLGVTTGPIGSG